MKTLVIDSPGNFSYGSRNSTAEDFRAVIGMLESGQYPVAETITQTVKFSEAGSALRRWSEHPGLVTKIQVEIN